MLLAYDRLLTSVPTHRGEPRPCPTPRNVIIIGSGPAGYTAAVYAARASLHPLVFEGSVTAGGALMNTTEVENFPGFRDGIMGPALMDEMRAQAERFGAELVADDVVEVDLTGDIKVVKTATDTYTARAVILAMGSGYRKLGLPNEEELSGRGVSWCATCDGFFFRDQHIAVVGGGDSAVEEATFLTRFGSKVSLIYRRDELRASKIMQERAFADPKLEIVWNSEVDAINGDDRLESVTLRDTVTGETRDLDATGLFIAIGHDPRSELLHRPGRPRRQRLRRSSTTRRPRTNLPGVFAAGDLVDHHYRQAVTAAGTGCAAALDAERYLADLDHAGVRRSGRARRRRGASPRPCRPPEPDRRAAPVFDWSTASARSCSTDTDIDEKGRPVGNIAAVTDAEFEAQVLKSDKPVLVDFWAEWCGPCSQVAPILDEIAAAHGDKITFLKMNVDENPVTPSSYRVTGIPTHQRLPGRRGREVDRRRPAEGGAAQRAVRVHRLTRSSRSHASASDRPSSRSPRRGRRPSAPAVRRPPAAPAPPRPRSCQVSGGAQLHPHPRGGAGAARWVLNPTLPRKSAGTTQLPRGPAAGVAERLDRPDPAALDQVAGHPLHQHPAEPAAARGPGATYTVVSSTASGETGAVGNAAAPGHERRRGA